MTAARAEGELNVIALPPDWANYGAILDAFTAKYGIKINSTNPDGSSQDEIDAVKQLAGTDRAPDVLDIGMAVALANTSLFAPYQVSTWKDLPDAQKEPTGLWFQDYGGFMSIGYDSAKVLAPTSVADLLKPEYKNKVALTGDPTTANAALNAVIMVSLASGGSPDDVSKGVNFFSRLKQVGNFVPVGASGATVKNGTTPVVFDWDYLNAAQVKNVPGWKVFVPSNAVVGGCYSQAVNADAPHPAGPDGRHGQGRHGRRHRRCGPAHGRRHPGVPHPGPGDEGQDLPGRPLGQDDRLNGHRLNGHRLSTGGCVGLCSRGARRRVGGPGSGAADEEDTA